MAIKLYNAGNKKSIKWKSFRMKWLLLYYMKIVKENKYLANYERIVAVSIAGSWNYGSRHKN